MTTESPPDRRKTALVIRLVLLWVVLVLAAVVVTGRDSSVVSPARVAEQARPAIVAYARKAVETVFTYDWTDLERNRTAANTMTVQPFTARFLSTFDNTIATPATQQHLRQTATVLNIGVIEASSASARLLMLVQFSAQRQTTGQSTNAPGVLVVQMVPGPSGWLLAELTPATSR
ncbi:hypothetical protein ACQPX6_25145 [Actinomycetospora sp. CA-101289]|uniref:hypothetical protein n=1 Tax=Actinomycetospora sp. CA-101289 TaxID=3239893 RepID=UPI003D9706E2